MALKDVIRVILLFFLFTLIISFIISMWSFYFFFFLLVLGPIYHYYRRKEEQKELELEHLLKHHPDLKVLNRPRGTIVYRWSFPPSESSPSSSSSSSFSHQTTGSLTQNKSGPRKIFPVCIPGGLGSTLALTSLQHEAIARAGYSVLSFDRIGTGFSSIPHSASFAATCLGRFLSLFSSAENEQEEESAHHTIQADIEDMHAVMEEVAGAHQQWLIVGGSFGSLIGQLYTAYHPKMVKGFLCLDGLPHTLYQIGGVRRSFRKIGKIYWMESLLSDLGVFRLPIFFASHYLGLNDLFRSSSEPSTKESHDDYPFSISTFSSTDSSFSSEEIYAQVQSSQLLRTIAWEVPKMEEAADALVRLWGSTGLSRFPPVLVGELAQAGGHYSIWKDAEGGDGGEGRELRGGGGDGEENQYSFLPQEGGEIEEEEREREGQGNDVILDFEVDVGEKKETMTIPSLNLVGSEGDTLKTATVSSLIKWRNLRERVTLQFPPTNPLSNRWEQLQVRVLSCRSYFYDPMEWFMSKEIKDCYHVEHVFLSMFAKEGERMIFENVSHMGLLRLNDYVVAVLDEMSKELEKEELNLELGDESDFESDEE